MAHDPPAFIQERFRIRVTDAQGLNAAFDAGDPAENANTTINTGSPFRIRFKVRETAGGSGATTFKIQCNRNSGGWVDLAANPASTTAPAALVVASTQFSDGDATTAELLTSTVGNVNGEGVSLTDISTGNISLTSQETEIEFSLMLTGFHDSFTQNVAGNTIDFRVVEGDGTVFGGTYTNPTITVGEGNAGFIGGAIPEHPDHIGPFWDANGNMYTLIESSASSNRPVMIKSTNGGDTWREMDAAGRPTQTDCEGICIVQEGDTLHVLHSKAGVYYHKFTTSDHATTPDEWVTIDQAVDTGMTAGTTQWCTLGVRSDGDLIAVYVDVETNHNIYFQVNTGSGWSAAGRTLLDSTASTDHKAPTGVMGASDKFHVFYKDTTNAVLYHRSISSTDTLGTIHTVRTTVGNTDPRNNQMFAPPIYYDNSGTETINAVYYVTDGNGTLFRKLIENDGTPGSEQTVSDNNVEFQEGGNNMVIATIAANGTTLYCLYTERANYNVWYTNSANGATWATDTQEVTSPPQNHWLRGNIGTHSSGNGGATVFGYIRDKENAGMYIKYFEEVISTPATEITRPLRLVHRTVSPPIHELRI